MTKKVCVGMEERLVGEQRGDASATTERSRGAAAVCDPMFVVREGSGARGRRHLCWRAH